jgi:hypothetical protein
MPKLPIFSETATTLIAHLLGKPKAPQATTVAARAFFRTRYAKIVIDAGLLRLGDEPDVEDGSEIDIGGGPLATSAARRRGG